MGTLFSALDIARAGMHVAQVQLDVTGHNIANVNREGYSRQRVDILTRTPLYRPFGAMGRGPAVENIVRLRDTFLDGVYRSQVKGMGRAEVMAQYFTRIEDIFQEPSPNGLSSRMNVFFDALNDFANAVDSLPARVALLSEGEALAGRLNETYDRLNVLRTNANEEIRSSVTEINSLTERIARLNRSIRDAEIGGLRANDLRDNRDLLLDELARMVNITSSERSDGQVTVLLGGEELVNAEFAREITVAPDPAIDPNRQDLLVLQYAETGQRVYVSDGSVQGLFQIRDVELRALQERMDALAAGLIENINRIHNQGNGLIAIGVPMSTSNAVSSPFAPLMGGGELPFTVQNGSFDVVVYDSTGSIVETITVPITPAATLGTIEGAISASPYMNVAIGAGGLMTVSPETGYSFTFANDSSNVLTALGLNGLFTGTGAASIAVNRTLQENPSLLSSGYSLDMRDTGDNRAALAMAELRSRQFFGNGVQTINEFYESGVVQLGVNSRSNQDRLAVEQAFVLDFDRRRQEVSGVNLDEEVTSLLIYQRAFEASARVVGVANSMLETLVNLVR